MLRRGEGADLPMGNCCSIAGSPKVFLKKSGGPWDRLGDNIPAWHIPNDRLPNGMVNGMGHSATKGHVMIENDVWIGAGCTIISGIRMASASVIAAGSVVVKDAKPDSIVGAIQRSPLKTLPQSHHPTTPGHQVVG